MFHFVNSNELGKLPSTDLGITPGESIVLKTIKQKKIHEKQKTSCHEINPFFHAVVSSLTKLIVE